MRWLFVLYLAFTPSILAGLRAEPIKWRPTYAAAYKESRDSGKPLVVEISRTDCINCVRFNKTIEADPALSAMLNLDTVPVRVLDSANPGFKVSQFPTVYIVRPSGKVMGKLSGFEEAMNGIGFGLRAAIPAKPAQAFCINGCGCDKCNEDGCRCGEKGPCKPSCQCVQQVAVAAKPCEIVGPPAFMGPPTIDLLEDPGVMSEGISREERLSVNGLEVAAAEGKDRLFGRAGGENDIPADGDFLRLTVVGGTPEERKRVTDDAAGLARWKGAVVVNSYPADHWAIKDLGFVDGSLYVQCPPGKVLHRQALASYGGPGELDGVLAQAEAIRKRDPNYDPKKDPDLRSGADGDYSSALLAAAIAGGVLLLLFALGLVALGGYLIVRKKGP